MKSLPEAGQHTAVQGVFCHPGWPSGAACFILPNMDLVPVLLIKFQTLLRDVN